MHPIVSVADLATVGFLVALESLLSADNALVMAVMVARLPEPLHRRALNLGLIGALTFRVAATAGAIYLIHAAWLKLIGGLYLVYLAVAHFRRGAAAGAPTRQAARPDGSSGFWGTILRVEVVNLAFSVDSILVAVALSSKFWVVLAGGLLGVMAMRVVVRQLVSLIQKYPTLVDGAFVVVAWVGLKLLVEYLHQTAWISWEIPQAVSLALVVAILTAAYVVARRRAGQPPPAPEPGQP